MIRRLITAPCKHGQCCNTPPFNHLNMNRPKALLSLALIPRLCWFFVCLLPFLPFPRKSITQVHTSITHTPASQPARSRCMDNQPKHTPSETWSEPGGVLVSIPADELTGKYSCCGLPPRFQGTAPICTLMPTGIETQTQVGGCGARLMSNPRKFCQAVKYLTRVKSTSWLLVLDLSMPFWEAFNLIMTCSLPVSHRWMSCYYFYAGTGGDGWRKGGRDNEVSGCKLPNVFTVI